MIHSTLLQAAVDTVAKAAQTPPAIPNEEMHLFDILMKGGYIMIPIGLLAAISIYFFVERLLTINKASRIDNNFMANIKDMITNGNIKGAKALCERTSSPIARMLDKGVSRIGRPLKNIEVGMESVANLEIYKLEKTLFVLSTVAAIAPMFGFLGTVYGMIKTFFNISQQANIEIGTIADGIYVKMVSSAAGLIVGLMSYVFFKYLQAKMDKVVNQMDMVSFEFLDLLQEPTAK